jgi:hypothetical protein
MHLPSFKPDVAFMIDQPAVRSDPDQVDVWEGWHLKEGEDPGRYVMTAGDVVLVDKEWTIPVFPIPLLAFGQSYSSAAGDPLARQLLPFQLKLNRFNRRIEENAEANSHPQTGIPIGGGVDGRADRQRPRRQCSTSTPARPAARACTGCPARCCRPSTTTERDQIRDGAYAAAGVSRSSCRRDEAGRCGLWGGHPRGARRGFSGRQLPIADALEDWDELQRQHRHGPDAGGLQGQEEGHAHQGAQHPDARGNRLGRGGRPG